MKFDRKKWMWRGLAALAALAVAAAFFVGRMTAPARAPEANGGAAEPEETRERVYTCSMHPQVRSRDPNDKCPICGMELIPVPDDGDDADDADLPRLRVSARAAALMEIETVPARRVRVEREIPLYGRIEADERLVKSISAWTSGRIDQLHIDFTGQRVRAGEPMLELYSPPLIAAQEELLQALESRRRLENVGGLSEETARSGVVAAREKLRLLGLAPEFIDELETSGEVRELIEIPAPLDGIVTARLVSLGEYVQTGRPMFSVADLSSLWVRLSVFESDLAWMREGLEATFTTPSHPGRSFTGTVSFIDPTLDVRSRSVLVRLDVPNEEGLLKPGMFARGVVRAALDGAPAAPERDDGRDAHEEHGGHGDEARAQGGESLVIPATAPLITGRRAVVYVRLPDTERPTFEARDVLLGPRAGDFYVVREGLEEGELVVSRGAFRIDSELQIRGRPSMMSPEGGGAPGHQHGEAEAAPARGRSALPPADFSPQDVPDDFAAHIVAMFDRYIELSESLAGDDLDGAGAAAAAMLELLHGVDLDQLDDPQRDAWRETADALHDPLHAIEAAADIEEARRSLEPLTEATARALHHFTGEKAGTVYRAHCPMAFDFEGADWLQREERISNPYFGASMLRCGTVEIEIAGRDEEGGR